MIWFLTLSLVFALDGGMGSSDAGTVDEAVYRIQITGAGRRRNYARFDKSACILDALKSLPQELIPKLNRAKIGVIRGADVLEVDWPGIDQNGNAATNYQLFGGDRILVDLGDAGP